MRTIKHWFCLAMMLTCVVASLQTAGAAPPAPLAAVAGAKIVVVGGQPFAMAPFGAIQADAKWPKPDNSSETAIRVCWERLGDSAEGLRAAVRDAVLKSWGFYGLVAFTGWDECKGGAHGIRIGISTGASGTVSLGSHLDGVPNGMMLRMDFTAYPDCATRNEFCVRATAVHEFGHALAMAHEQNRPDAPGWCSAKHKGGDLPDTKITKYDPQSIMNYCNPMWNNNGLMSPLDIETVGIVYGARA